MSKSKSSFRPGLVAAFLTLVLVSLLAACEEEETAPGPVPDGIEIVSGNGQYSKQGTELEDPIVVQVVLSDGEPAAGVSVAFTVRSGGGTLSRASANTNSSGQTSVRWTLGSTLGTQEIGIALADNGSVQTLAQATAAAYYCPEENPTFVRAFSPARDLLLFTRESSVISAGGDERAGVVQLGMDLSNLEFDATPVAAFSETIIRAVVRDCAFAANGEFYIAWTNTSSVREVAKVATNGSVSHFATLEGILGVEITWLEGGVLAGCDEFGPFTVGCRDTLTRYPDALYSGTLPDQANYNAVAYDDLGNFLYFIYRFDRSLRRLPLNGYTQTGPVEDFVTLASDEASGASGMAAGPDGTVYILVESTSTKSIVQVTSGGVKTTLFDFFSRGAGDAAGKQADLALLRAGALTGLYTLDTLNNVILLYDVGAAQLHEIVPDRTTDTYAASDSTSGEAVGLAIVP